MKLTRSPKLLVTTFFALLFTLVFYNATGDASKTIGQTGSLAGGQADFRKSSAQTQVDKISANDRKEFAFHLPTAEVARPAIRILRQTPTSTPVPLVETEEFLSFVEKVKDGQTEVIRGVFVQDVLGLPIIQQPVGEVAFVSNRSGEVTQFKSAADADVIGLLAHNYLAGKRFYRLVIDQEVRIIYGDGNYRRYRIDSISQYQKLTPSSLHSDLIDLQTGQQVTTEHVFARFYRGVHHVTFQTCLEKNGLSNWGLTFIVASPILE